MSRRIFVSNIPVRACVDGWVEIPEDDDKTPIDDLIAEALMEGKYTFETPVKQEDLELDKAVIADNWSFTTPVEG